MLKERWDIYWNGTSGARELTHALLTAWRYLLPACGQFAEALVPLLMALSRVAVILVAPLLFWTAPFISIFAAHRSLTDDEVRARMRRDLHRNGTGD